MEDGYYWATPKYQKTPVIIKIKDDEVSMMGDDRSYKLEEFSALRNLNLDLKALLLITYGNGLMGKALDIDKLISALWGK